MRRETLPESQGAETAGYAVPTRAGAPLAAAGSPGRRAVAGLGLGREAPQQARRPSECPVCRGMRTGGGGHPVPSPWGAGETQDAPKGIGSQSARPEAPVPAKLGGPTALPAARPTSAAPPASPPAPYRTPRPRRATAASLRAALRSVSALRGLGPPPPSAAASAALSAGPPRAAAGARPGAPRASASSRLAAPSGAGAPAAGRGFG